MFFFAPLKKTRFDSQKQGFRVKGLQNIEKVQFPRLCFKYNVCTPLSTNPLLCYR